MATALPPLWVCQPAGAGILSGQTQSRGPLLAFAIGGADPHGRSVRARVARPSPRLPGHPDAAFLSGHARLLSDGDQAIQRDRQGDDDRGCTQPPDHLVLCTRKIAESPVLESALANRSSPGNGSAGFMAEYNAMSLDNPHNSYLQMAVYAGIPALVSFLLANLVGLPEVCASRGEMPIQHRRRWFSG